MIQAIPVPLPSALVEHHAIDLQRKYTDGWGVRVDDVATAPTGEFYALYGVSRYTYGVADDEADPAKANFGYALLTRYASDGTVLATAVSGQSDDVRQDTTFGGPTTGLGEDLQWARNLCVLPDGTLAATGPGDQTHLITADLTAVTARHYMPQTSYDDGPRKPFASWISTTPAGRLLCTTGEFGLYNYANLLHNIVSITDQPLTPTSKPTLRALASLEAEPVKHTEADVRPDVLFNGEPVGMDHRPRPSLTEHLTQLEPTARQLDWHDARLGRPAVVREDLFVVPIFGHSTGAAAAASGSPSSSSTTQANSSAGSAGWTRTATPPSPATASQSPPTPSGNGSTTSTGTDCSPGPPPAYGPSAWTWRTSGTSCSSTSRSWTAPPPVS
ncbi:hypothetical protein [Streptomyces sp. NPDC057382]|uniref:hypothetical protein n=1 Tax=unclassified Streptomyces TaxID=2593676 RepID=UPI00362E4137